MFSYINLGFYQTWDEFLRELQLIHKSQIFIFLENLSFHDIFQSIQVWVIWKNSYLKVLFSKSSDPKRIFTYFIHHLKVIISWSNASTMFVYFQYSTFPFMQIDSVFDIKIDPLWKVSLEGVATPGLPILTLCSTRKCIRERHTEWQ